MTHAREDIDALSPEEIRQILHELRVHQIELEMQNEELRLAQAELDAARVRYFDLYDLAPVGYFTVSEKGLIIEANLTAAALLGVARGKLVNQPISQFILRKTRTSIMCTLKSFLRQARHRRASCGCLAMTERHFGRDWNQPSCRMLITPSCPASRGKRKRKSRNRTFRYNKVKRSTGSGKSLPPRRN